MVYIHGIVIYKTHTVEVRQTIVFRDWLDRLKDQRVIDRIIQRIARLETGLLATSGQSARACPRFGSIMDPDTDCTSCNAAPS